MLKYFFSFFTSIIIFVIFMLIKRNSSNTYWVKFWFMSFLIPMFLFFLLCTVYGKTSNDKIIGFIFTSFFLFSIIVSLSEHNKIQENKIINNALFRKEKVINIDEIEKITFTFSLDPNPSAVLNIQTFFNTYSINSRIENIDSFLLKIKEYNNNIIISGNKWHGFAGLIILNLITFVMLVYTMYQYFEVIIK